MADSEANLRIVIDGASDGAESAFKRVAEIAAGVGLVSIIESITTSVLNLGEALVNLSVESAAGLENTRVAFDSAFGAGAGGMLSGLEKLSYQTTLTSDQINNMALKMQTAGVPTKQIQGNLLDLADIASGTSTSLGEIAQKTDALGQILAIAYERGSVSAIQLRGIAAQNVPIYDALVKVINAQGGIADETTKQIDKTNSKIVDAQAKHEDLTQKIADSTRQLKLMEAATGTSGVSLEKHNQDVSNAKESLALLEAQTVKGTLAQAQHAFAIEKAQQHLTDMENQSIRGSAATSAQQLAIDKQKQAIKNLNEELVKTNHIIAGAPDIGKHLITKEDLLSNSKNIKISADALQAAFQSLGEGKYLGAAGKQANTFNGEVANLQKTFMDLAHDIIGVSSEGEVKKGGVFFYLEQAATTIFKTIQAHKDDIAAWATGVVNHIVPLFKAFIDNVPIIVKFFTDHQKDIGKFFTDGFDTVVKFIEYIITHKKDILDFANVIIQNAVVISSFINKNIVPALKSFDDWLTKLNQNLELLFGKNRTSFTSGINSMATNFMRSLHIPGFAQGTSYSSGGMALVGENGPELVSLPQGTQVMPSGKTQQMMGQSGGVNVTINNPVVRSQNDITMIVQQVKQVLGRQLELAKLGAI